MLSDKIKQLRNEKGLSQEELAIRLNVVRQTVSKWEKGLSLPDSDILIKLAAELDTSVSELLEENINQSDSTAPKIIETEPTAENGETKSLKSTHPKTLTAILLILGSPIWLSLLVAAVAVGVSVYVSLWAVIVSIWAVFAAVLAAALYGVLAGFYHIFGGYALSGIALIGASLFCAGLSVFLFFGCKVITIYTLKYTKSATLALKNKFFKRGATK